MANYRLPEPVDPFQQVVARQEAGENRTAALEGRRLSTWDRQPHNSVAAPVEGQHIVEPSSEKVWYYSNGQWRTLGSTRPWVVLENLGQTLASGSFTASLTTDAYWDPELVTDPNLGSDTYFDLNTLSSGGTDYFELTTRVEGWYSLELVHLWSNITSLTTSPAYGAQQINFNTTGIPFFHDRQPGGATDWANAVTEINGYAYIHTFRTIWLPADKAWPVNVKQTTGDSRDCSGHLKVWYEGNSIGGGNDNADFDFATA